MSARNEAVKAGDGTLNGYVHDNTPELTIPLPTAFGPLLIRLSAFKALREVNQNDAQQSFILGNAVNVPLNSQNSLDFEFARAFAHQNSAAYTGFAVK